MHFKRLIGPLACGALILTVPEAYAQRRGGPHHVTVQSGRSHAGYPRAAIGLYYGGFFGPDLGLYYGPGFYAPYYPPQYLGYAEIDVRIQVTPQKTEVYVDGSYAGIVDDFDGLFQRLHLPPGDHEIQFYLEGYRTVRKTLYLNPGTSYKVEHEMERLAEGETQEPRPSAPRRESSATPIDVETPARVAPSQFGVLVIRVQPTSAEILIDGEPWSDNEAAAEVVIHLAGGRHRVEVRKHGYQSFETAVELRAGETSRLNIRLPQSER